MIEKIIPIMPSRFSNEPFALQKCRILHIEKLISYVKFSGIKLLMNIHVVVFS